MDWREYKALCDSPRVFSRWMLEQTIELLESEPTLASLVASSLDATALQKPIDHRGGVQTDMFEVSLSGQDARTVVRVIDAAVTAGRATRATRGRGLGGFREAWLEYARFVEQLAFGTDE